MNDTEAAAAAPDNDAPAQWAILELMGHQRLAGRISQQAFGGANLIRVDVPEVVTTGSDRDGNATTDIIPAHTRSLGASSIYSINWVDEMAATVAAHSIRHRPIQTYALKAVLDDMPPAQRDKVLALGAPDSSTLNDCTRVTDAGQEDNHVTF